MTKRKATKAASPPAVVNKSRRLEMEHVAGKSGDRLITDMLAEGIVGNASMSIQFAGYEHSDLSLTDMLKSLKEQGQAVNGGDFSAGERMLNAQAVTLNLIFTELARRAASNLGQYLGATESYLRLALKAQSQSRATLETLAAIKNPPTVFARQANINNGGQQQVNNGPVPRGAEQYAPVSARPRESVSEPNELLEDRTHGSTQLDTRATAAAGRTNQNLDPMGAVNGTKDRFRQGEVV